MKSSKKRVDVYPALTAGGAPDRDHTPIQLWMWKGEETEPVLYGGKSSYTVSGTRADEGKQWYGWSVCWQSGEVIWMIPILAPGNIGGCVDVREGTLMTLSNVVPMITDEDLNSSNESSVYDALRELSDQSQRKVVGRWLRAQDQATSIGEKFTLVGDLLEEALRG